MQMKEARALQKRWGKKPCDHPEIVQEHDLGSATGDYVCTTCGQSRYGNDWNDRERENKKQSINNNTTKN